MLEHLSGARGKTLEVRAECESTRQRAENSPAPSSPARLLGRQVAEQGPLAPHGAPHRGLPGHPPASYQGESSVLQPRGLAATSERGQVAAVRFRAHGGPAPRPCSRGSWLEGGSEQAQPVSQHSPGGGGRRRQKLSGNPWEGSRGWWGSWCGWRWRSRGCRLADTWRVCCSAPRRLISMNATVVAPPPAPPLPPLGPPAGEGTHRAFVHRLHWLSLPLHSKP